MQVATVAATVATQTPYTERPPLALRRTSSQLRKPVPTLSSLDLGDVVGRPRRHSSVDSPLTPPAPSRYTLHPVPGSPVASMHASVEVLSAAATPELEHEPGTRRSSNTLLLNVPVDRPGLVKRWWAALVRTLSGKVNK